LLIPRCTLLLALGLTWLAVAAGSGAAAQVPQIGKPRPAPPPVSTMPPLRPATIDDTLAIDGDDIVARKVETRLSVEVLVNGHGPYQFIVDSGADTSVVGLRIAHQLRLPLGTPVILNDMTDRSIVDRVKVDELTLGPSTITDLELPALREQDLGGHGILGIDSLSNQRLMMDFERRRIQIEDAARPPRPLPGEIVVTARRSRGQLILTQVSAGRVSLDAVIDTGSQITIGNLALRDQLIGRHRSRMRTVSATGVTGKTVELQLAYIPELRLGSVTLRDVPVAFADVPPFEVFGLSDDPALLLGTDLLEAFQRVSLDFRARKVRFQLRRCAQGIVIRHSTLESRMTRLSSSGGPQVCR
jgi:hypothetical protein